MDPKDFEKFRTGQTEDVKEATDTSAEAAAAEVVEKGKEPGASEEKLDLSEDNSRNIPYKRFKEKVEAFNELKKQNEEMVSKVQQTIEERDKQWKSYYEAEIASLKRQQEQEPEYYEDYDKPAKDYDGQIKQLMDQLSNVNNKIKTYEEKEEQRTLRSEMSKLKEIYPESVDEHVYALKKMKPQWSLEECAERSHKYFEDNIKSKYDKMMEAKKNAAKKTVLSGGKIKFSPEEKPKNMKEARAFLEKYLED